MKNKIALKLVIYFSITLILFSTAIGAIFMTLFRNHTVRIYKGELERRAETIAATISEMLGNYDFSQSRGMMQGGMMMQGGLGYYVRNLDNIAMADVWIVDENLNLITIGKMTAADYNYSDLPKDADVVVKDVFSGKTTFSEGFSELLNAPSITAGTPIYYDGKVFGALLIHSPISGMDEAVKEGYGILSVSIMIALLLSVILSVILALSFTRSLKMINDTADSLARGDYSAKTGVRQNDEIGELASTVDILSERLDSASRERMSLEKLRKDFIANISHELRTPVTVIRGSLEALCDEVVNTPGKVKEYHCEMLKESKYLERMVNDLLDLSRLQNTDFKIELVNLNLCEVLDDAVRTGKNIATKKNIKVDYERDSEMFAIKGDYTRLRQLFLTIVDNAVKFSSENSEVKISLKENIVSIKDNGAGIDEGDIHYIFERFYKEKSEQNKEGTGLGLAIAKQIAERHGIKISVKSKRNEGTEFLLEFKKIEEA
jgi:signal transduction histidine kinase